MWEVTTFWQGMKSVWGKFMWGNLFERNPHAVEKRMHPEPNSLTWDTESVTCLWNVRTNVINTQGSIETQKSTNVTVFGLPRNAGELLTRLLILSFARNVCCFGLWLGLPLLRLLCPPELGALQCGVILLRLAVRIRFALRVTSQPVSLFVLLRSTILRHRHRIQTVGICFFSLHFNHHFVV